MTSSDIFTKRRSVRQFTDQPIARSVLEEIFTLAQWAPSSKNSQPWNVFVASGKSKNQISEQLLEKAMREEKEYPDFPFNESWPIEYKKRVFANGMAFYEWLGINRKNLKARKKQTLDNFSFFGAPTIAFIFLHEKSDFTQILDAGIYLGQLLSICQSLGIATCPQAAVTAYPNVVKSILKVPPEWKLTGAVAMGYKSETAHINGFQPKRLPLKEAVHFLE